MQENNMMEDDAFFDSDHLLFQHIRQSANLLLLPTRLRCYAEYNVSI